MNLEIAKKCDIGRIREKNQDYVDYVQLNSDEAFLLVCDGMGGHKAGEIASKMTGEYIIKQFLSHPDFENEGDIREYLMKIIQEVNYFVYDTANSNDSLKGMGTTIAVVYINHDEVYISHVGDSRVYLIDDAIKLMTRDDTLVNLLVDSGAISEFEARYHPQRNILLQAIGVSSPVSISYRKEKFTKGILLCSDGLYTSMSDERILELFNDHDSMEEVADSLIDEANKNGGFDNIGVVVARKENDYE